MANLIISDKSLEKLNELKRKLKSKNMEELIEYLHEHHTKRTGHKTASEIIEENKNKEEFTEEPKKDKIFETFWKSKNKEDSDN